MLMINTQGGNMIGILGAIRERKSVLAFSDRKVEEEKINSIFEAARWAPSSMNLQPWRYIYSRKKETAYQLMFNCLHGGNQQWAKNAQMLILSVAQVEYSYQGAVHSNQHAWHDTGAANSLLMLQAADLGMATHPMGGFDSEEIRKSFSIPKEYEPVAIIALGYEGNNNSLPQKLQERANSPRLRKPLGEFSSADSLIL